MAGTLHISRFPAGQFGPDNARHFFIDELAERFIIFISLQKTGIGFLFMAVVVADEDYIGAARMAMTPISEKA